MDRDEAADQIANKISTILICSSRRKMKTPYKGGATMDAQIRCRRRKIPRTHQASPKVETVDKLGQASQCIHD